MKEKDPTSFPRIDPDKVAQQPHLLPYAHTVGGSVIRPIDRGRVKGQAMAAMYDQTEKQLDQLRAQVSLLAEQAQAIRRRVEVSERIYLAELPFQPVMHHDYHLYKRPDGTEFLSMIAPSEWGRSAQVSFQASVRLCSDHTWEILTTSADSQR
ncbi:MAG: hypothetical protein RLY31_1094 [Bacteroidota bacterium]